MPFSNMRATALLVGVLAVGSVLLFDTADGALSGRSAAAATSQGETSLQSAPPEHAMVVNADGSPYDPAINMDQGFDADPYDMADDVIEDYQPEDPVDAYEHAPADDPDPQSGMAPPSQPATGVIGARID